ncbi:MAG: hypothetical protein AAF074_21535, partial [Pseudomonadota bacterium]
IEIPASRRKAAVLAILAGFVVLAFAGADWFRWAEPTMKWAAMTVGFAFAGFFIVFALMLFFRRLPVFTADETGLGMPMGGTALAHLPWEEIESYGVVTRPIPFGLGLSSRVFGVRLREGAAGRLGFSDSQQREVRLNRASMDTDVLLTHWFAPVGFDHVLSAARSFRGDLERQDQGA